jgi:hypothetical protein
LTSIEAIQEETELLLDKNPLDSLFNFELAHLKPPPLPSLKLPKPKRDRKADLERKRKEREAEAAARVLISVITVVAAAAAVSVIAVAADEEGEAEAEGEEELPDWKWCLKRKLCQKRCQRKGPAKHRSWKLRWSRRESEGRNWRWLPNPSSHLYLNLKPSAKRRGSQHSERSTRQLNPVQHLVLLNRSHLKLKHPHLSLHRKVRQYRLNRHSKLRMQRLFVYLARVVCREEDHHCLAHQTRPLW